MKIVGLKPCVIQIKANESIVEGNLADIPLVYYSKTKEPVTAIEYVWKDSKGVKHSVSVRGSSVHGLLNEFDFDVLMALVRLYIKSREICHKRFIIDDKSIKLEDLKLNYTNNEILKEMGNMKASGANNKRVQISIEKLVDFKIHGDLHDSTKEHQIRKRKSYSILQGYQTFDEIKGVKKQKWKSVKNETFVVFDPFFIRSIFNSYFKYFDYDRYLAIGRQGVAKKLYLIINKWRNNKRVLRVKLTTLYERIPLDLNKEFSYNKQVIKRACEKLKLVDIIKDYAFVDDMVEFVFVSDKQIQKVIEKKRSDYTLFTQVMARLKEHGLTDEQINDRMNYMVANFGYTKALMRYIDDLLEHQKIDNLPHYVLKGLATPGYTIDESYYNEQSTIQC